MPMLSVNLDADGKYPECKDLGNVTSAGLLHHGMRSGAGSVIVEVTTADGKKAYGQTSLALLVNAAEALKARDEMNREAAARGH